MRDRFAERRSAGDIRAATPTPPPEPTAVGPSPEELDISAGELEAIMSPAYLETISGASGFSYTVIDEPPPGVPPHVMGFTDMKSKRIYLVKRNAAFMFWKLKKEGRLDHAQRKMKGFLVHEGGHHAPEVLDLDQRLRALMGNKDLEPNDFQEFFNDPNDKGETKELFWKAVWFDVCNGSLDMWLEAYQSRGQFARSFGLDLLALHDSSVTGRDFLQKLPLHHQLTQWLVGEEVYLKGMQQETVPHRRARELDHQAGRSLDPEVAKVVTQLRQAGTMSTILSDRSFAYWGGNTPEQKDRAIGQKFEMIVGNLFPAWTKLLLLEFNNRKAAFKEQIKGHKPPLTDEEIKVAHHRILKELLDKTQQAGQAAYGSETPSAEDQEKIEQLFKEIKEAAGASPSKDEGSPPPPSALDQARADMNRRFDESESRRIGDLAGRFGVSEASLRRLQEIESQYSGEIERLAADIAEAFLAQRRAHIRTQMVEGQTTFGMEDIEMEEAMAGNLETRTHQITEQAAEFLQTEIEHLFDTSGSMRTGDRLKYAQIVSIILARVFEQVKKLLEGEGLLRPEEEDPLRTGFVLFTNNPERIKKLDEVTTPKSLAQMIEQTNTHSGGTDDAAAIAALTTEFKFRDPNVLKFMMIYSDGEGNPGAVKNIMESIQQDKSIIVIVVAMGANPGAVAATYEGLAGNRDASNIFVVQGNNVSSNLPLLSNFIKKRVREAAERLS